MAPPRIFRTGSNEPRQARVFGEEMIRQLSRSNLLAENESGNFISNAYLRYRLDTGALSRQSLMTRGVLYATIGLHKESRPGIRSGFRDRLPVARYHESAIVAARESAYLKVSSLRSLSLLF